jgi:hypothetical protein
MASPERAVSLGLCGTAGPAARHSTDPVPSRPTATRAGHRLLAHLVDVRAVAPHPHGLGLEPSSHPTTDRTGRLPPARAATERAPSRRHLGPRHRHLPKSTPAGPTGPRPERPGRWCATTATSALRRQRWRVRGVEEAGGDDRRFAPLHVHARAVTRWCRARQPIDRQSLPSQFGAMPLKDAGRRVVEAC